MFLKTNADMGRTCQLPFHSSNVAFLLVFSIIFLQICTHYFVVCSIFYDALLLSLLHLIFVRLIPYNHDSMSVWTKQNHNKKIHFC